MPSRPEHETIRACWDGHSLELEGVADCGVDIGLDGSPFTRVSADGAGRARLEFPFSPSGQTRLTLQIQPADAPSGTSAQACHIELGRAGLSPATDDSAFSAAPAPIGERLPASAEPMRPEAAIVIPVYNAAAEVRRCLDSVLANSSGRCRLIVIDDASTEPEIARILDAYRGIPGVGIHANPVNLGFTATVNRGMSMAGAADIVLLNADTEVASQWLTGLRRAAYSSADVATATAVSDNAGAFSVPELERENPLPPGWTFAQAARAHWQLAGHAYPQLPTGNGFCMYIRRSVLDRIGLFDVEAFPQGYGEENDFCQRACAAGYRHLIAGNVLVRHARSMSFGTQRREVLGRAGMQVLRQRWPNYESDVGRQLFSFERRVLDWRVRRIHALAGTHVPLPRVLRFGARPDPGPRSGYDVRELQWMGSRLCLDGVAVGDQPSAASSADPGVAIPWLLEDQAIELLEIEQGMDQELTDVLQGQASRLGIPVLWLANGERASSTRREVAMKSLDHLAGMAR